MSLAGSNREPSATERRFSARAASPTPSSIATPPRCGTGTNRSLTLRGDSNGLADAHVRKLVPFAQAASRPTVPSRSSPDERALRGGVAHRHRGLLA